MQSDQQQNNPMLDQLHRIKSMMKIVRTSANPEQMLALMAQSNPDLNNTIASIGNTNPKDAFYTAARRKGLTDEQISAFLKELAQ